MSKHKQKYILMQKNPQNNEMSNERNRAIPKNPLSINKKLALLKANAQDRSNNQAFSSRNHHSNTNNGPIQRTINNQIQSSGSSIIHMGGRIGIPSEHSVNISGVNSPNYLGAETVNASIINIADNMQF